MVYGKKIKIEDSDDEQDPDFIQKLLKETEVKNSSATTSQKIIANLGGGADLIRKQMRFQKEHF